MNPKLIIEPLIFICVIALSGCAGTGAVVEYYPVQSNRAPVAAPISPESVRWYPGPAPTNRPEVTVIGGSRVFATSRMRADQIKKQVTKVAAEHGANAIFLQIKNVQTNFIPYETLPIVMDVPRTSYSNTSSQIYSPYSGYIGSINTTGTTTTNVPTVISPARSGIARVQTGELIVQFAVISGSGRR